MPKRHSHRSSSGPPLGQVFLKDTRIERRIVDSLGLQPDDIVLEVGAGPGNMTALLAVQAGSVETVEIDPALVSRLRQKLADCLSVRIWEADILDFPIDQVAHRAGRAKIKLFGNLPYYITSPCLMHFFRYHASIELIVVMVQEEVARRMVASPGSADYGLLSLTCQYYTRPTLLFSVGPKSFSPPPKVRSAVVRMAVSPQGDTLGIQDEARFWILVRTAFSQKRKTLFNNLKGIREEPQLHGALEKVGIDPRARAETLSLEQFAALYKLL